jgi:inorganic pyrophosphatase
MTHLWHDIAPGTVDQLNAIIEIPDGSRVKYEVEKQYGLLMVDRIIPSSVVYPGNYGFIPQTLAEDDDPIDVLVLTKLPLVPGVLLRVRPLGGVGMIDEGKRDDKIICVLHNDPSFSDITCVSQLPDLVTEQIEEFFSVYKRLDRKKVEIQSRLNAEAAKTIVIDAIERYKQKYPQ